MSSTWMVAATSARRSWAGRWGRWAWTPPRTISLSSLMRCFVLYFSLYFVFYLLLCTFILYFVLSIFCFYFLSWILYFCFVFCIFNLLSFIILGFVFWTFLLIPTENGLLVNINEVRLAKTSIKISLSWAVISICDAKAYIRSSMCKKYWQNMCTGAWKQAVQFLNAFAPRLNVGGSWSEICHRVCTCPR